MGLWRTFKQVMGWRVEPTTTGLRLVYDDALELARRAYSGKSISRRDMAGRMSQPRWSKARQLLMLAGVLDRYGRLDLETADTLAEAERRTRAKANELQRNSKKRHWVSPI